MPPVSISRVSLAVCAVALINGRCENTLDAGTLFFSSPASSQKQKLVYGIAVEMYLPEYGRLEAHYDKG